MSHLPNLSNAVREFSEHVAGRAVRANAQLVTAFWGRIDAWFPQEGVVKVHCYYGPDGWQVQTMPLLVPWAGAGYGLEFGPVVGSLGLVLECSPTGDDRVFVGFSVVSEKTPALGVPAGECWIVDPRGSSIKLEASGQTPGDGQAGLNVEGAGYFSVTSPLSEIGAKGLDPTANAVVTQADLQAAVDGVLALVQPGSGLPPGTVTAAGSTTVRASS